MICASATANTRTLNIPRLAFRIVFSKQLHVDLFYPVLLSFSLSLKAGPTNYANVEPLLIASH